MMLKSNLLTVLATCLAIGTGGTFLTSCTKDSRNTADVIPGEYKLDRVQWSAPAATRADEAAVDVSLVNVDSLNVHGGIQVYVTGDASTDKGTIHIELPLDYFISRTFNLLSSWSPVPVWFGISCSWAGGVFFAGAAFLLWAGLGAGETLGLVLTVGLCAICGAGLL